MLRIPISSKLLIVKNKIDIKIIDKIKQKSSIGENFLDVCQGIVPYSTEHLTKEEINLLFNDIDALRDEANALNMARDHWDRQIRGVRNSTSWKLTSKLRNARNRGDND